MSTEAQKPVVPVEQPVVAPIANDTTTATSSTAAPVAPLETSTAAPVESKPVETTSAAPVTETTESTAAPVTEEVAPVKEPQAPIEEGVLGYKGVGLLKSLIFSKKHFWFGAEPVEHKNLTSYLRGEKQDVANHNAAWAAHTGKGLLFFSKKSTEKLTPAHVFNLSEVSNITEDGPLEFHFTQGGHKHTFQAASLNERENWVATLKSKVEEAKTIGSTVKDTEEYKSTHTALSAPVVAATSTPSAPKKSTDLKDKVEAVKEEKKVEHEAKKEEKAEEKAEKAEKKEEIKEEKKDRTKSRSASRKRTSIFGSIGFGKKEDKVAEVKPEVTKDESVVAPAETSAAPVAPVSEPVIAPVVAPVETAPTAPVSNEPLAATNESVVASDKAEARPTPNKRNSIFDSFRSFGKKPAAEEKKEEAPVVPAKEPEPVSESAPVIPTVQSTEPLSTSVATPATAPVQETAVTNGETKPVESPTVKSDKRKSSIPFFGSKKKDVSSSDEEAETTQKRTTSPFAKFRATVKGKSTPKEKETTKEKTPEPVVASEPVATSEPIFKKEETALTAEEPVKKDAPVTATPQVATSA